MATATLSFDHAPNATLYAYPAAAALASWATYRVLMTEAAGTPFSSYTASIDTTQGNQWHVYEGATQPASTADAVGLATIPAPVSSAIWPVFAGQDWDGNAPTGTTSGTLNLGGTNSAEAVTIATDDEATFSVSIPSGTVDNTPAKLTFQPSGQTAEARVVVGSGVDLERINLITEKSVSFSTGSTGKNPITQDEVVYRGQVYSADLDNAATFSQSGWTNATWVSGSTGVFRYKQSGATSATTAGTVTISMADDVITATLALTKDETEALTARKAGNYELEIVNGSNERVLAHGKLDVRDRVVN